MPPNCLQRIHTPFSRLRPRRNSSSASKQEASLPDLCDVCSRSDLLRVDAGDTPESAPDVAT